MAELDLIPTDYRELLRLRAWLLRIGVLAALGLMLLLVSRGALALGIRGEEREVARLRAEEALAIDRRGKLERLSATGERLQGRLDLLSSLRGGVAARDMFVAVDRALDGRTWLLDWRFRRAGEWVDKPDEAVSTGYFLVVPQSGEQEERAWRLETHMEMKGQAFDHSALARFTRSLLEQPEVEDVRVLNTRMRSYTESDVVDFELAVVVRSQA